MLRITVHNSRYATTLQLEGTLTGPWLRVLDECWRDALALDCDPIVRVDLTGVTFIDHAGKACLKAMHRQGAEFIASDCMTKAILAEIAQSSRPEENKLTT